MEKQNTHAKKKRPVFVLVLIAAAGIALYFLLSPLFRKDDMHDVQSGTEPAMERGIRTDADLSFLNPMDTVISRLHIEIVADAETRRQGLMGRTRMEENEGMLFIFGEEEERSFWMANTPLSLDIIYLNSDKKIVSIQKNATPFSEESLPSVQPAMYVVEVNAGYCERHGLSEGIGIEWKEREAFRNTVPKTGNGPEIH